MLFQLFTQPMYWFSTSVEVEIQQLSTTQMYYLMLIYIRSPGESEIPTSWALIWRFREESVLYSFLGLAESSSLQTWDEALLFFLSSNWRLPLAPRCHSSCPLMWALHIIADNRALIFLTLGLFLTSCYRGNSGQGPPYLKVHNLHYICKVPLLWKVTHLQDPEIWAWTSGRDHLFTTASNNYCCYRPFLFLINSEHCE